MKTSHNLGKLTFNSGKNRAFKLIQDDVDSKVHRGVIPNFKVLPLEWQPVSPSDQFSATSPDEQKSTVYPFSSGTKRNGVFK
jgi:hypothetical protein